MRAMIKAAIRVSLCLALASCNWGVFSARFEGDVCGSEVKVEVADGKARQGFSMHAQCDEQSFVKLESIESSVEGQETAVRAMEAIAGPLQALGEAALGLKPAWPAGTGGPE